MAFSEPIHNAWDKYKRKDEDRRELMKKIIESSSSSDPLYYKYIGDYLGMGVSPSAGDVLAADWKANIKPAETTIQPKDVLARIERILRSVRPNGLH